MATVGDVKKGTALVAMFFAGLILLIPHRIGMSRVNYVIKRYNLPISRAGLLLYKYHNNIELSLLIGCLCGTIVIIIAGAKAAPASGDKNWKDAIAGLMIAFLSFMLISSIIMFIIYVCGGDFGHLNAFYFSLIFLTFFDGFTNAFAFCVNPMKSSLYAPGIPLSGFLVTLLHYIYKFFSDLFHWNDFDYYVLFIQLLWNIIIVSVAAGMWIAAIADNGLTNVKPWGAATNHNPDASPILMLAFSLGTVYAFYPSIAPYSIIDFQYASIIELWILCISSLPTLGFGILDAAAGDYGPGTCYNGSGNWSHNNANWYSKLYHCFWICAIPYILCIQIFMSLLHYPHSSLSCFFNNKPLRIGFISVLFNTIRECLQALGFAGAGKQKWVSTPNAANDIHGGIAAMNKPITLFIMMLCVFTGDGYLQHYRRCCRDNWPTTGYNKYQSFFYWLRFGFKGGIKSITSSFTTTVKHTS